MSKTPKVSVIMPAYNAEKYISEAIESILNQTFKDFEFIIINDGSTDNTAKIVKQYAKQDKRIRFIDKKKNMGFIARLNDCLDLATGEFIAKMDSDDISLAQRLEKQVKYLQEHKNVGMVGCGYRAFDKANFEVIHVANVGLLDLLKTCATTIIMVRREILNKNNLRFNPEFLHAEDYDFYSRFIRYAPIHNLQEVLYLYRWHGNNVSITKNDIQVKNSEIVRKNIMYFISGGNYPEKRILDVTNENHNVGILLPKWLGRICCLFIFKRDARHNFRNKYVKD